MPHNTFSLWNKYQFTDMFAAGLGVVHKTDFFAALDNTVRVPGYTRLDAALYLDLNETWSAQLNVENLLNEDYFVAAHNNNNIMPGAPTSVYVTVGEGSVSSVAVARPVCAGSVEPPHSTFTSAGTVKTGAVASISTRIDA